MQDSGQPEDAGTAQPEGAGTEATRGTISRRRRRENSGQPGDLSPRQSRKVQARGNPPPHQEARLEERSRGATQSISASSAEGREKRGNSRLRRRHSRKMQKPGQPGGRIGRHNWKSVAAGETPGYCARSVEGSEIRGDSKIHRRQGRKVRNAGATRSNALAGATERVKCGATWASPPDVLKDARREATRRSVAGKA
jgi:hypothetical protein